MNDKKKTPRILVVRLSAIGDAIQTMPVACALRDQFPDAYIAWAVERRAGALLEGHPALDELIQLPRGWLKSPSTVWRLRGELRSRRFDTAIDVQSLTKSAVLAWLSGARLRVGFGNPGGRELSKLFNNRRVDPKSTHVVDSYLELLRPLGIERPAVRFDVPQRDDARQAAEEIVRQMDIKGLFQNTSPLPLGEGSGVRASENTYNTRTFQRNSPHPNHLPEGEGTCVMGPKEGYAIINPGAGWPSKLWPTERYAAVSRHLGERWRLPTLVVWAGEAEKAMAERIVADGGELARLAPPTSLPVLAALARRARLFVGADTGPLHLAAAVDTPCVGLYGPWPARRHGPYGPRNIALQQMAFEGSARGRRAAPPIYMESITTELVCEACDRILQRGDAIVP